MINGYSVTEAASVLGVPTERVWELLARGVLAGAPEGETGMRVFLQPRPSPAPVTPTPVDDPGAGRSNGPERELSPFRELLTEFRNLTERYGQALLALGEARGEVASLRSRVDLLEARIDLRLPMGQPPAPWPTQPVSTSEPAVATGSRVEVPAEPDDEEAHRRRRRGARRATESFAQALARAEDPSLADLPGGTDAVAAAQAEAAREEDERTLPRDVLPAEPVLVADEEPASAPSDVVEPEPAEAAAAIEEAEAPHAEPSLVEAEATQAEPSLVEAEPEPRTVDADSTDVEAVSAEPEPVSIEPEPADVEDAVRVEPEPVPDEPMSREPELGAVESESRTVEAERVSVAEPVTVEPESVTVGAEPTTVEPGDLEPVPGAGDEERVEAEAEPPFLEPAGEIESIEFDALPDIQGEDAWEDRSPGLEPESTGPAAAVEADARLDVDEPLPGPEEVETPPPSRGALGEPAVDVAAGAEPEPEASAEPERGEFDAERYSTTIDQPDWFEAEVDEAWPTPVAGSETAADIGESAPAAGADVEPPPDQARGADAEAEVEGGDSGADEMEVAGGGQGGAGPSVPPQEAPDPGLPGSRELDEALDAFGDFGAGPGAPSEVEEEWPPASERGEQMAQQPRSPSTFGAGPPRPTYGMPIPGSPATRAYRRLRRIFPT